MEEDMQFAKDSELRETEEELARLEREEGEIRKEIMAKRDQARRQEAVIGTLMEQLALRENEVDRIQNILDEKDRELAQMEDRMKANGSAANANSNYSAYKGDAVDEQLAKYINMMQCQVPIKRLGNGYYLFGTRKIFAKIMNGKLVIRVGGGYMIIEEFIATYADQEINRCKMLEAQQLN
jgi:hypothetical protein